MNRKDFDLYIKELENMYGKELNETELKTWYEELNFMTIERFNYILSEIYKTNKYMPKLSDIMEKHKSIPYQAFKEQKEITTNCEKCNNTGYILYNKVINGKIYNYTEMCDCGRQQRYDGKNCLNPKNQSNYYIPTIEELNLNIQSSKPNKQKVIESMNKIKNTGIVSEEIKEIIRKQLLKEV